ncbi:MAG TPA: glycosyltransferase [Bacteroidales bacterium]|nr:glycosyltransferase [Bacteroidales bacterium]HQN15401.1 glycosyltransferase [Bacteroidales bacterium]HQP14891.1 glycosyltransferase [Bacteroidales bacterium]
MTLVLFYIIAFVIALCYCGLILFFTYGWYKNKTSVTFSGSPVTRVSVIVAFRNEERNMEQLLKSLSGQHFPAGLWEVILVDDHSSDGSRQIAEAFIREKLKDNFRVISLAEKDGFSKKAALKKGIACSQGVLIITTDADCTFGPDYVRTLVGFYEQCRCRVISAPVVFADDNGLFSAMASLEFLSLVASGAGAMTVGQPFMANGANLCFERSLYDEVQGYAAHQHLVSGDDVFLVLQAKKTVLNRSEICFLKDTKCLVQTMGTSTLKGFFNQRIRWASKSLAYSDFFASFTAYIVFCFSAVIVAGMSGGLWDYRCAVAGALLLLLKVFVDFPLLYSATSFVKRKRLLLVYLPLQIIYPLYITITGILSLFVKFEWKGRKASR